MQFPDSIGNLLDSPLLLVLIIVISLIIVLYVVRKRVLGPSEDSAIQKVKRMHSTIEKGNDPEIPVTKSRQDIITDLFESKMNRIGMEPSSESGYIPISTGDFSDYMIQRGVKHDTMRAIIDDLPNLKKQEVVDIVEAAAETADADFTSNEVEKAKELALNEWKHHNRS